MITTVCKISYGSQTVPPIVPAVQGDTGRAISFEIADFTPPAGATATYFILKPSGEAIYNSATITDNSILCELTAQSLAEAGENRMQVRVLQGEDIVTSFEVILMVRTFLGDDAIESGTEMNIFDQAVEQATEDFQTNAEQIVEEVIESIPEDYTALTEEVDELNERMDELYIPSQNLYNPTTDRHGKKMDGYGNITDNTTYKLSDYIEIGSGNKVSINGDGLTGALSISFYTDNNVLSFTRRLYLTSNPQTFTLGNTEKYIVLSMYETTPPFMVNIGETLLPYVPYGNGTAGDFLQSIVTNLNNSISEINEGITDLESADTALNTKIETIERSYVEKNIINRFNKATISEGKYINVNTGGLSSDSSFFASDYIYIGDLSSVTVSHTHIFGWYDANKTWLGNPEQMNSNSNDITIAVPENAVYLRFSNYNSGLDLAQIGENVSRTNYVQYGKYTLPDLIIPKTNAIIVDASGNGDYTSLTEALYEHVNDGLDIEVKPGTYNIVSEYIALFGQEAVDSMADADSAIFNGFQYGIIIRNRTIKFDSGSYVVCDWTGHTVNGTHRFSALRVDYNCKIIGLHLVSTATFYAIHDDYGLSVPYTVEYEHCYVEGINLYNANCIGGGCKKYSRHIIKNCYFNNHLTGSATVRYHNTNAEGAVPEIYVSNCYFNNWFTPRWYGTQTSKMKVYVNNCEASAIYKTAESSSFNVDNVELYKWCNTETNPVT